MSQSLDYIWKSMTRQGFWLGTLCGLGVAFVLLVMEYSNSSRFLGLFIVCGVVFWMGGGVFGGVFGIAIGFVSGLIMREITRYFTRFNSVLEYRVLVGLATLAIAILIFVPLFQFATIVENRVIRDNYLIALMLSIGIAVYASQRTASKYLRHADVRKKKVG